MQRTAKWNDHHRLMYMVKDSWTYALFKFTVTTWRTRSPTVLLWHWSSFCNHRIHCISHHITSGNLSLHLKWNFPTFVNTRGRVRLWEHRRSLLTLWFHGTRILRTGEEESQDTWKFTNLGKASLIKSGFGFSWVPMTRAIYSIKKNPTVLSPRWHRLQ